MGLLDDFGATTHSPFEDKVDIVDVERNILSLVSGFRLAQYWQAYL